MIGSISHDNVVRFWDVSYLHDNDDDDEGADEGMADDAQDYTSPELLESLRQQQVDQSPAGDDEMSDDDDDDDDSDDGMGGASSSTGGRGRAQFKTSAEQFFEDL